MTHDSVENLPCSIIYNCPLRAFKIQSVTCAFLIPYHDKYMQIHVTLICIQLVESNCKHFNEHIYHSYKFVPIYTCLLRCKDVKLARSVVGTLLQK